MRIKLIMETMVFVMGFFVTKLRRNIPKYIIFNEKNSKV